MIIQKQLLEMDLLIICIHQINLGGNKNSEMIVHQSFTFKLYVTEIIPFKSVGLHGLSVWVRTKGEI